MKKRTTAARAKQARRAPATKVRAKSAGRVGAKAVRAKVAPKSAQKAAPQASASDNVFALPAECTTADAEALKVRLAKLLANEDPVTLDRAAVQRIDTATLQMLAAFVRDRRANGLGVEWSGDAPAFTSAVTLLGLNSLV
jgi:anti-anti-sigma regulatory factor